MRYLIDPARFKGNGNCKNKACDLLVCSLCAVLCPDHNIPLYGVDPT